MKVKNFMRLVIASMLLSTYSLAQNNETVLDEIVISSSRFPNEMRKITTSVSVLTASDIEARGSFDLNSILRTLPGVHVSNSGGAGSLSALRVRGEESYRTLTILDGIRISDPSGTQISTQMEHILSSNLERVEVLRGPQGLVYGADAGGVISLYSPVNKAGVAINSDVQTGSFNTRQYSGSLSAGNQSGDIYLQGSDFSTDGFNARSSDNVIQDEDGYQNTTLHTRLGWNLSNQARVEIVHRNVDGDTEFDGCFDSSFSTVHNCDSEYDLTATRIMGRYDAKNFSHSLTYAESKTHRENFSNGDLSFEAKGVLQRWEYLGQTQKLANASVIYGVDFENASSNDVDRDNVGGHIEYIKSINEAIFLSAGLRYDDNDDFGSHVSHRVGLAYVHENDNGAGYKVRINSGTGFRAPSPFESAYNQGAFAYPPASLVSLKEENSQGYEAAIEYFNEKMFLQAVYFDQKIENAIVYDLASYSGYLQETGESTSKGIELSGQYHLSQDFSLSANYTYTDAKSSNGQQAIRRPKDLANIALNYSALEQRLSLNVFYSLAQDAVDQSAAMRVNLKDHELVGITTRYKINDNFVIFARVENMGDVSYQEVSDFNVSGRATYIGVKFSNL